MGQADDPRWNRGVEPAHLACSAKWLGSALFQVVQD